MIKTTCIDFIDLDADEIINAKMDKNEVKYPVEKARGSAAKYTGKQAECIIKDACKVGKSL